MSYSDQLIKVNGEICAAFNSIWIKQAMMQKQLNPKPVDIKPWVHTKDDWSSQTDILPVNSQIPRLLSTHK